VPRIAADLKHPGGVLPREGVISTGKAAELLGVSKLEFVRILDRHGVAYFTQTPEEVRAEVEAVEKVLAGKKR